jgi:hypothetical protein
MRTLGLRSLPRNLTDTTRVVLRLDGALRNCAIVDHAKAQIKALEEAQHLLETVRIPYYMRQLGLSEPSPTVCSPTRR